MRVERLLDPSCDFPWIHYCSIGRCNTLSLAESSDQPAEKLLRPSYRMCDEERAFTISLDTKNRKTPEASSNFPASMCDRIKPRLKA